MDFTILLRPMKITEKLFYQEACRQAPRDFIIEHSEVLNWNLLSAFSSNLTDDLIEKYEDKIDWDRLITYQKVSENIMRKYHDKIYWKTACAFQVMSEDFITEFEDKIDWSYVSKYQNLSSAFVLENIEKINIISLAQNKNINKKELNTPEFVTALVLLGYDEKMFTDENFMYRKWRGI